MQGPADALALVGYGAVAAEMILRAAHELGVIQG